MADTKEVKSVPIAKKILNRQEVEPVAINVVLLNICVLIASVTMGPAFFFQPQTASQCFKVPTKVASKQATVENIHRTVGATVPSAVLPDIHIPTRAMSSQMWRKIKPHADVAANLPVRLKHPHTITDHTTRRRRHNGKAVFAVFLEMNPPQISHKKKKKELVDVEGPTNNLAEFNLPGFVVIAVLPIFSP